MKSPWQREWEEKEREDSLKEIARVVLFFGAVYLIGFVCFHGPKMGTFDKHSMAGAVKYQAQAWLGEE